MDSGKRVVRVSSVFFCGLISVGGVVAARLYMSAHACTVFQGSKETKTMDSLHWKLRVDSGFSVCGFISVGAVVAARPYMSPMPAQCYKGGREVQAGNISD